MTTYAQSIRLRVLVLALSLFQGTPVPAGTAAETPATAATPTMTIDEQDQLVIEQLRSAGADLRKPTEVVNYIYIPSRADAESVAKELRAVRYSVDVQMPLGKLDNGTVENRFSVIATTHIVPSIENIRKVRAFLEAFALRCKGEFDGWEAAVTK